MNSINLLPWRLTQYRQLLLLFLLKLVAVFSLAFLLYAILTWFQHQQKAALNQKIQTFEQQKARLMKTVQHVSQMKQSMQDLTTLQAIKPDSVAQVLSLLPQFPFQQGELATFHLNDEGIKLSGFCLSQQEFESLHEFLSSSFSTVKLTQFKTEQGRLLFQFDLPLESEKSQ